MRRLRSALTVLSSVLLTVALTFAGPAPAHADVSNADLAYRWAPIHYQDTSSAYYPADYLAPVDYDGDWNTLNNWEDLDANVANLVGTVYYSVVETSTEWYVVYGFFHARDWKDYPLNVLSHENDMEGLLEVVHKDGSTYGTLNAVVTLAHDNFYSYLPPGSPYTAGSQNIDGNVIMQDFDGASHPVSFQEDRGHGCFAWDGSAFPGGDGIVYHPSRSAGTVPAGGDDRSVSYHLVDVFGAGGLWDRRNDSQTYASFGAFAGDNGEDNAAHAPWAWDDFNDGGDLQAGAIATDPAYLTSRYFGGTGSLSLTYTSNPYQQ